MSKCVEFSTPYTGDPTQHCNDCGERVSTTCNDCGNYTPGIEYGQSCEDCNEEMAASNARQKRDDAREVYGDWLRDEGKAWRPGDAQ